MTRVLVLAGGGVAHISGGVGTLMVYLMEQWARDPDAPDITVIDTRGQGGRLDGVRCFLRAFFVVGREVAAGRVQLVHAHMTTRGSAVRKSLLCGWARGLGVPVILHLHGADFQPFYRRQSRLFRRLLCAALRRARYVIVLGQGARDFLVGEVGIDPARVAIVANGVPAPAAIGGSGHVLFLGRLGARKGVKELIEALATPALRARPWQAVIAGDGDAAPFRAQIEAAGLGGRIELPGWVGREDAAALLAHASMLVLPSHHEAMPIAVLEALAARVPVIATPVGAIPEFLQDGTSALLVPPGDPQRLADAIGRLLDEPATGQRLAEAGHRVFAARLDIRVVATAILGLYREAMA